MIDFPARFQAFLDEFFALEPLAATSIGDHRHDGRWPDVTEAGRAARLAFIDRWATELRDLPMTGLRPDDVIDRDLVLGELEAMRFAELDARDDTWNPLTWVYLLGDGIFPLLARDFAPLVQRLTSVAERLEGMPAVLDGARDTLVGPGDGRPIARFQTEKALDQLPGIGALIDDALTAADAAAPSDPAVATMRPRLVAAADTARAALAAFEAHLRDVVLPASAGDGRLGVEMFAAKMRHTMRSEDLTPERILAAAEREHAAVRAEMVRLAEIGRAHV